MIKAAYDIFTLGWQYIYISKENISLVAKKIYALLIQTY